jgi:hypothetical protein
MKIFPSKVAGLALSLFIGFNALGVDIYNSYPTYNDNAFNAANNAQIGNEITLNSANVVLTGFNFEYFTTTTTTFSSSVAVELRLYNGAPSTGSLFYDNSFSPVTPAPGAGPPASPSGGADVIYNAADFGGGILLPKDFTFTLTFTGLGSGDTINLLLAGPPSGQIGSTTPNYWYNTGSGFSLLAYNVSGPVSADLAAEFTGFVKTPDASVTAGLLGLGLMGIFVLHRKFAQNLNTKDV